MKEKQKTSPKCYRGVISGQQSNNVRNALKGKSLLIKIENLSEVSSNSSKEKELDIIEEEKYPEGSREDASPMKNLKDPKQELLVPQAYPNNNLTRGSCPEVVSKTKAPLPDTAAKRKFNKAMKKQAKSYWEAFNLKSLKNYDSREILKQMNPGAKPRTSLKKNINIFES